MAHAGQRLHGHDGFVLRIDALDAQLLDMEASYGGAGPMPPAHLHPSQDERFDVLEGAVRTIIGDVERRYAAGESFAVPAGTVHRMAADAGTRMRWRVSPALRTAEFFEGLYGGRAARDGAAFLEEFSAEFRLAP